MALNMAYQDKGTLIHHLDPRVKLVWLLAVSVIVTTWDDPLFLLGMLLVVLIYAQITGIGMRQNLKTILSGWPFILLIVIFNLVLWQPPSTKAAHLIGFIIPAGSWLPTLPVYWETLVFSLGTMLRIFVLVINIFTMTRTISPTELALAITRMGIPTEIGMALSMALSYIPTVIGQLVQMMETQQSRALRMDTVNPLSRFLAFIPIIIPTFFRSFQTAEAMATSMLSRGFGYDISHRTELKSIRYNRLDWSVTSGILLFLVGGLTVSIPGFAHYTTTLHILSYFVPAVRA